MDPLTIKAEPLEEGNCSEEQKKVQFYIENYHRLCRLCLTNERLVDLYSNVQGRNVFYIRNSIKGAIRMLEQTIDKRDGLPSFICEKCERNLSIMFNFKKKCDYSKRILEKVRNKTIVAEDLRPPEKASRTDKNNLQNRYNVKQNVGTDCQEILKKLPQSIIVGKPREPTKNDVSDALQQIESINIKQEVTHFEYLFPETKLSITDCIEEDDHGSEDSGADDLQNDDSVCDFEQGKPTKEAGIVPAKKPPAKLKRKALSSSTKERQAKEKTICSVCGVLVSNIRCHMITHEEVRPHQCELCPKSFTSRTKLQCHVNSVHLRKRDYKCEICGKAFLERNHLKGHLRIHNGERKYKCKQCPKTFLRAGTLRYHELTHTQDKKHECQICGQMFLLRATLNQHIQVHNNERPHKCDVCDKAFRTTTHRIVHMRTHTGEKPLLCRICGLKFAHHRARNVHMKTKHAEELVAMDLLDWRGYLKF